MRSFLLIGGLMATVGAGLALLSGHRPEGEVEVARREGLWTEPSDAARDAARVPEAQNAAPAIRRAVAREKALGTEAWNKDAVAFLKGAASPDRVMRLRTDLAAHPELTALWRAASARPRVDYHRRWADGAATLFPEYAPLKRGARRLAVAARLGERPRENLLAAARLSNVTRQEPVIIASLVAVSMGRIALREARCEGLGREVEASLGPPIDVRRAYAAEPSFDLDVMRNEGRTEWYARLGLRESQMPSLASRLLHGEPRRSAETAALLRDWRGLWRELPRDGTDYAAAARAMRKWRPRIERRLVHWSDIYARLGAAPGDEAQAVDAFAKFEAERRAARGQAAMASSMAWGVSTRREASRLSTPTTRPSAS